MTRDRPATTSTVRFSDDDLDLFSLASHDRNPLHLDAEYARTTQFGQRVVFGVLGGLACAGAWDLADGRRVVALTLDLVGPMFCGPDYTLRAEQPTGEGAVVTLCEGSRPLVRATFKLGPAEPVASRQPGDAAPEPRREAARLDRDQIVAGRRLHGRWRADTAALHALRQRLDVSTLSTGQTAALLWCSYVIGMEVPGRRALFSRAALTFTSDGDPDGTVDFDATVISSDERFGLVRLAVTVEGTASGELRAFVRQRPAPTSAPEPADESLVGRVALVVGASRGLGSLIAAALVRRGATVYGSFLRSAGEMDDVRDGLGDAADRLVPVRGDGADPAWCAATVQRILADTGHLDVVVCNASPTILPMWFEAATVERTTRYVADSLDLVAQPLAAALPALVESRGWVVAVSSRYADTTPASYPHYVAAKGAIEGLVRATAHHHRDVGILIVRPPRLLGEVNIPVAGEEAIPGEVVAATIADRLAQAPPHGAAELLDDFTIAASPPARALTSRQSDSQER